MTEQDPRPDVASASPPVYVPEPVNPAGTGFDAATVTPAEPQTVPELAGPSFTVPQQPVEPDAPADKLWVHFMWEGLLLVLVALGVAAFLLFGPGVGLGGPDQVAGLLVGATPFLLLAMALGLSMRAGAVNLAVVHLALLSTTLFSVLQQQPLIVAIAVVAGAMAVAGILLALFVTVFRAPGWAAGLLIAMAAWFLVTQRELDIFGFSNAASDGPAAVTLTGPVGWVVIGAIVALSIAGGLIGIMKPVRDTFGVCVDATEQRCKRTPGTFGMTWAALIGSCLLAGAAGYLALLPIGANLNIAVVNANGLAPLLTCLGIVLIGGTSLRGRRGGVFGTLLAAVVVFMVAMLLQSLEGSWIINNAIPFGALLLGLLVNWLLDLLNRSGNRGAGGPQPVLVAAGAPVFAPVEAVEPAAVPPAPEFATVVEPDSQPLPMRRPAEPPPVAEAVSPHVETPTVVETSGDTTQELPADANPYLYRPPAGLEPVGETRCPAARRPDGTCRRCRRIPSTTRYEGSAPPCQALVWTPLATDGVPRQALTRAAP